MAFKTYVLITTKLIAVIAAILGILLSVLLLLASFTNLPISHLKSNFGTMAYITSLCFAFLSISVLLILKGQQRIALWINIVISMIVALTLLQYLSCRNLGSDQIFSINVANSSMFYLLIVNIALLIICLPYFEKMLNSVSVLLALIIITVTVMSATGYSIFVESENDTFINIYASISALILGIGILCTTLQKLINIETNFARWLPIVVTSSISFMTLVIWLALEQEQNDQINRLTISKATSIKNVIFTHMRDRTLALQRISLRWENRGGTPKKEWLADANNYVKDQPGYHAVEWVDTSFHIRWIAPLAGNESALNYDLTKEETRYQALKKSLSERRVIITPIVKLLRGGEGFWISSPIYINNALQGFTIGIIDPEEMINTVLMQEKTSNFAFSLVSDGKVFYRFNTDNVQYKEKYQKSATIPLYGTEWQVITWPTRELIKFVGSFLPTLTLMVGLILALLLGFLTKALQIIYQNLRMIKNARIELESSNNLLNGILEGTPDLVLALDKNFQVIAFNSSFKRVFKKLYNTTVELGKNFKDLLFNEKLKYEKFISFWERALQGKIFSVTESIDFNNQKDPVFYDIRFSPIRDAEGKLIGASHFISDITQRIQSDLKLQESKKEVERGLSVLQSYNEKMLALNEVNSMLQACMTSDETFGAIEHYCQQVLGIPKGAIYVAHTKNNFKLVRMWGNLVTAPPYLLTESCWALRRSQLHKVYHPEVDLLCEHVSTDLRPLPAYLCIPIQSQGQLLGLLHLVLELDKNSTSTEILIILAKLLAEQFGVTMINLELREKLRLESIRDPLTNLYNRRYLEETIQLALARAERESIHFGIILIDIDHFKEVNDTHGHLIGDKVLQVLAQLFQKHIRKGDIACRWGGEEFLLYLHDVSLEIISQRANQIKQAIEDLTINFEEIKPIKITVSEGVALYSSHLDSLEKLITAADEALYQAKEAGRNKVVIYKDE